MFGSLVGIKWGGGGKFPKRKSAGHTKLDVLKLGTEHLERDLLSPAISLRVKSSKRKYGGGDIEFYTPISLYKLHLVS